MPPAECTGRARANASWQGCQRKSAKQDAPERLTNAARAKPELNTQAGHGCPAKAPAAGMDARGGRRRDREAGGTRHDGGRRRGGRPASGPGNPPPRRSRAETEKGARTPRSLLGGTRGVADGVTTPWHLARRSEASEAEPRAARLVYRKSLPHYCQSRLTTTAAAYFLIRSSRPARSEKIGNLGKRSRH